LERVKTLESNLQCPACQQALKPKVLACDPCDIKVEGPFELNEFATLAPDDLHFLRIFVHSEGRVRDMESALGLSYPTIRARLSALKTKLGGESKPAPAAGVGEVLQKLEAGEISFDEAMKQIKRSKK
jgi:hypothetical protein